MWRELQACLIDHLTKLRLGGRGFAWHTWITKTGYSVDAERETRKQRLEQLCKEAVTNKAWIAHDITGDGKDETFCNRAARYIAQGCGWEGFGQNDTANIILRWLKEHQEEWPEIPIEMVSKCAMQGELVILGCQEEPHGHLVTGYPDLPQQSSTWKGLVPLVAHVGRSIDGKTTNGIIRLSGAFRADQKGKVKAYRWEGSIA